jgi:hypothetical protein
LDDVVVKDAEGRRNGGAIRIEDDSSSQVEDKLEIKNSKFISCVILSGGGGALFVNVVGEDIPSTCRHRISLSKCEFSSCRSADSGGAVQVRYSSLTVSSCKFSNCHSDTHGGCINCDERSEISVFDSFFDSNSAGNSGGAYYSEGSTATPIKFTGCNFTNCSCVNCGGALCFFSGNYLVSECIFQNCHTDNRGMDIMFFFLIFFFNCNI